MLTDSTVFATIAVRSVQLAKEFYGQKLGLTQIDENPGGVVYESGTGRLYVYESQTAGTSLATCAAWAVEDVAAAVDDLQSKGVTFENYDIPNADVDGFIYTIGRQQSAWFKDPDGNILSVSS